MQVTANNLGAEVERGAHILVLGFRCTPRVVHLEALIAVAGLAVHAALGGLLHRWLARAAHDGDGCAGRLPVALHDALQREVAEEHADAALAQINVVLAARAREGGDARRD